MNKYHLLLIAITFINLVLSLRRDMRQVKNKYAEIFSTILSCGVIILIIFLSAKK